MKNIPYGKQSIDEDDVAAVVAVLQSEFLTQGPRLVDFEIELADFCGTSHAVAVNSATSALHLAYLSLGLGPGKLLWTSPNTFVATANAALLCGAAVDFVDIDPHTYNLDPKALETKLGRAKASGAPLPDVVAVVDFAGQPCPVVAIQDLARRYGFRVVEDASHAIGATWRKDRVGCGTHADITVFSFHPVKIITSAEGGAALTRDDGLAATMRLLRTHGVTRDPNLLAAESPGPWYYEQVALGLNYRMTDIQAALGLSQLRRITSFLARRREIAARYDAELIGLPVIPPWQSPEAASAYHLYPVVLDDSRLIDKRGAVFLSLRDKGIGVQVHYIPVHTQPYYRRMGFKSGDFPQAERYYANALSLPIFPTLTDLEQGRVIEALKQACDAFSS